MKRLAYFLLLAGCFGLGMLVNRGLRAPVSAAGAARPSGAHLPESTKSAAQQETVSVGPGWSDASPEVKALFAGFDRRKPLTSQYLVLQRILEASPTDLAGLTKEMSGTTSGRGNTEDWILTRNAVMERWLELAPDEAIAWAKAAQSTLDGPWYLPGVIGTLARLDPVRAVAEAQGLADPEQKSRTLETLIRTMAATDPEEGFRLAQSAPLSQRVSALRRFLYARWGSDSLDIPSTLTSLKEVVTDEREQTELTLVLMSPWTSQDPAGALAWAKGLTEYDLRQRALSSYFGALAERDPVGAIAQISEFPRPEQSALFASVVDTWVQADSDAAMAWVLARPSVVEQQRFLRGVVTKAVDQGSMTNEQASQLVTKLNPGLARHQAVRKLLERWIPSNPEAAATFSKSLPAAEEKIFRPQIVLGLATRNPEKAIAYLKENPIDNPDWDLWLLAKSLAKMSSPAKAVEWASALVDERSRQNALPTAISYLAEENPAEAAKQSLQVPDETTRRRCVESVARVWTRANLHDALAWATGLDGRAREEATDQVLSEGAEQQPALAAKEFARLVASMAPGTTPVQSAGKIATSYFAENQQDAAEWATSLPHDATRVAAVQALARRWVEDDSTRASQWIGTLPAGAPRDAAVRELVDRIAPSDPATAFAWADTVANPEDRSSLLQFTLASWRTVDAPAARAAIEATDWPEAEKTKWLDRVK